MTKESVLYIELVKMDIFEIVELLLNKGANTDESIWNELRPLHIASQNGHDEIVKLLLRRKAKIDLRTKT